MRSACMGCLSPMDTASFTGCGSPRWAPTASWCAQSASAAGNSPSPSGTPPGRSPAVFAQSRSARMVAIRSAISLAERVFPDMAPAVRELLHRHAPGSRRRPGAWRCRQPAAITQVEATVSTRTNSAPEPKPRRCPDCAETVRRAARKMPLLWLAVRRKTGFPRRRRSQATRRGLLRLRPSGGSGVVTVPPTGTVSIMAVPPYGTTSTFEDGEVKNGSRRAGISTQESRRHQRPPEHQSSRSLRRSEFAESSGSSPGTARSSTCAARCPSATASGVVGTSIRSRLVPIGLRRPTTTQGSRCMEGTSLRTTSGWRIGSATDVTSNGARGSTRCSGSGCRWRRSPHDLNAQKVPTIHGTNRWTASSVRKAFVS